MKAAKSVGMLVVVLLFSSTQLPAQMERQAVVTATNVQLVAQPTFSADVVMPAAQGTRLRVLEVDGEWVRVFHDQQQAFVHSAFVSITAGQQQREGGAPEPAPSLPPQNHPVAAGVNALQPDHPDYKDPNLARIIGVVITGGGQFYAGKTGKGLALLGSSLGAVVVGGAISAATFNYDCDWTDASCGTGNLAPAYAGWLVALGAWGYGWYTAADDAQEYNVVQAGQRYGLERIQPIFAPERSGGVALGMRLQLR